MQTTSTRSRSAVAICLSLMIVVAPVARAEALTRAAGAIRARVLLADFPVTVVGISVRVVDLDSAELVAEVKTDANGIATLPELPFGTYNVSVDTPVGMISSAAPLIELSAENPTPTVELRLEPSTRSQSGNAALQDTVASVSGNELTLASGAVIVVNAATQWSGDHASASDISGAIAGNENVCLTFETIEQGGNNLATNVRASNCDDAEAATFASAGMVVAAGLGAGGGISTGLLVGLIAVGAAGLTAGVVAASGTDSTPEVTTQ